MIPTPDLLGLYYPSKDLTTSGVNAPDRIVGNGSSLLNIVVDSMTDATDFWNGAVGFFCGQSTATLRGIPFHVRKWDKENRKLQITSPLPVAPVAGDMFKLFVGGKTASSQEVLAMKVSGKQPEIDGATGANVAGVTIRKASAALGEGTLSLRYTASAKSLQISMDATNFGPDTIITSETTQAAVFNKDLAGFVLVDLVWASLRASGTYTDAHALTNAERNACPEF
ncbi:MAG: hypothetical protein LBT05_14935 [Planctomycetaceae bacterium]|jgi:hypothetical protein|nr:hypothetical protein [Planctomycetaceae bacterium]